jgi:hypothetical protein
MKVDYFLKAKLGSSEGYTEQSVLGREKQDVYATFSMTS